MNETRPRQRELFAVWFQVEIASVMALLAQPVSAAFHDDRQYAMRSHSTKSIASRAELPAS